MSRSLLVCFLWLVFCTLGAVEAKELALSDLVAALESEDEDVRFGAAVALWEMGPDAREAVPALIKAMRKDAPGNWMPVDALGRIGPAAVPALVKLVGDASDDRSCAALVALELIGPGATGALPTLLGELERQSTASYARDDPFLFRRARESRCGSRGAYDHLTVMGVMAAMGPKAVPELSRALEDDNAFVRGGAAYALGLMGERAKDAVPALIGALKKEHTRAESDDRCWEMFVWVLCKMGPAAKDGVPALVDALKKEESATTWRQRRSGAYVRILEKIGPAASGAAPLLRKALQARHRRLLKDWGALPAERHGLRDMPKEMRALKASADGIVSALVSVAPRQKATREAILQILEEQCGRGERCLITGGVGRNGTAWSRLGGDWVVDLADALNGDQRLMRRVQFCLSNMTLNGAANSEVAVPALIELLEHPNLRYSAARLLGDIGAPAKGALPKLADLLADNRLDAAGHSLREGVEIAVACAVFKIDPGNQQAVEVLTEKLKHRARERRQPILPPKLPEPAAPPIRRSERPVPHPEFLGVLLPFSGPPEPLLQSADAPVPWLESSGPLVPPLESAGVLFPHRDPPKPPPLRSESPKHSLFTYPPEPQGPRRLAISALREMGRPVPQVVTILVELLNDHNPTVRREAADALGAMGSAAKSAIPALAEKVHDGYEPKVMVGYSGAIFALAKMGPDGIAVLTKLLAEKKSLILVTEALALQGPAAGEATDALLELLKRRDDDSWRLVWVLGEIGPSAKAAVPALERLRKDKDSLTRSAAAHALEKIKR